MIKLTPEQQYAVDMIEHSNGPIRILGGPGVGKTTVLNSVRIPIVRLAPTNKAATLINGDTIHKFLGLTLKKVGGQQVTVATRKTPKSQLRIGMRVAIDESSCIQRDILHRFILPAIPNPIFIGDEAQLNPVNESSIPFMDIPATEIKLERVHRFEGEILEVAYKMRKAVFDPTAEFGVPKSWMSSELPDLDSDDVVIAWRNATIEKYTKLLKIKKFGSTDWHVGEHVRIGSHFNKVLTTESEWKITSLQIGKKRGLKVWMVGLNGYEPVPVVHEESREEYDYTLDSLASKEDWARFWPLKEEFCDLRTSMAITAHKSQGSTYSRVYPDYYDIFANPNREEAIRAAYVATTRASKMVRALHGIL